MPSGLVELTATPGALGEYLYLSEPELSQPAEGGALSFVLGRVLWRNRTDRISLRMKGLTESGSQAVTQLGHQSLSSGGKPKKAAIVQSERLDILASLQYTL